MRFPFALLPPMAYKLSSTPLLLTRLQVVPSNCSAPPKLPTAVTFPPATPPTALRSSLNGTVCFTHAVPLNRKTAPAAPTA